MKEPIYDPDIISKMVVSIGDVSDITGVPIRQLRYWENKGIIEAVSGDEGKTRRFDYANIKKIMLIKELIDEGYTLEASVKKVEKRMQSLNEAFRKLRQKSD